MFRIRRNFGEYAPVYRRALNKRPYILAMRLYCKLQFSV